MKKRAVQSEDKETKRRQIVSAAKALFAERDFFMVKMEDVAQKAGVAKGTLYLYFTTKEELFLAVTETELALWFITLNGVLDGFSHATPHGTAGEAAVLAQKLGRAISGTLIEHSSIPRDLSLVFNVLEHNVTQERSLAFKEMLVQRIDDLCGRISAIVPEVQEDCWRLLLAMHALMLGSWQFANPPIRVREAQRVHPEASRLSPTFGEFFSWSLRQLVTGFLMEPATRLASG